MVFGQFLSNRFRGFQKAMAMAAEAEAAGEPREKFVILLTVIVVPPEYFLRGLKDPFCT